MKSTALCITIIVVSFCVFAEPELKGNPAELSTYLTDVPKVIALEGQGEISIEADEAVVVIKGQYRE